MSQTTGNGLETPERGLDELRLTVCQIGKLVRGALEDARQSFVLNDAGLAEATIARDRAVNCLETRFDDEGRRMLSVEALSAADRAEVVFLFKVVADLEHIGDLVSFLCKGVTRLGELHALHGPRLLAMWELVQHQIGLAIESTVNNDPDAAAEVIDHQAAVRGLNQAICREVLTYVFESPDETAAFVTIARMAETLEDIAEHAERIADLVKRRSKWAGEGLRAVTHADALPLAARAASAGFPDPDHQ